MVSCWFSLIVLTDNEFFCSREPDHHSSDPWRPRCAKSELSRPRTRVLQLQQPRQQHPGVSLWTWAADIHCNSECHFVCCSTSWCRCPVYRLTFTDEPHCVMFTASFSSSLQQIISARSAWAPLLSDQTPSWRGRTARYGALLSIWGEETPKGHC